MSRRGEVWAVLDVPGSAPVSPERWRQVRRLINENRLRWYRVAAGLYPGIPHVGSTDLLCRQEWIPQAPVELEAVALHWCERAGAPPVDAAGHASAHVRPAAPGGGRYPTYAGAIAELDRPALFEDRTCYRLLDADLTGQPGLTFGRTRYFDAVNLGQSVAHELAAAGQGVPDTITMADVPLRATVGDPRAFGRRLAICAITTLTLRRSPGGEASFVLHWRDPARVNHAGGMYQVMPAGIFQPVTGTPAAEKADLSLWRCMVREFSEEFLGTSEEYDTPDGMLDYGNWPFYRQLTGAREAGGLSVWTLGLGVDPLTLASDILTVAVIDDDVFGAAFGGMVARNAEGRVLTEGGSAWIPFTAGTVARFTEGTEPMQPAGAALLQLAWRHRRRLLG